MNDITTTNNTCCWYYKGKKHRTDGKPAEFDDSKELYYFYGKLHRENNEPALIDKKRFIKEYYYYGKLHRENDEPARIYYTNNNFNKIKRKEWWHHNKIHRENGKPAVIDLENNRTYWYLNGKLHNPNTSLPAFTTRNSAHWYYEDKLNSYEEQPAVIAIDDTNNIIHFTWCYEGKKHRTNGPAYINKLITPEDIIGNLGGDDDNTDNTDTTTGTTGTLSGTLSGTANNINNLIQMALNQKNTITSEWWVNGEKCYNFYDVQTKSNNSHELMTWLKLKYNTINN